MKLKIFSLKCLIALGVSAIFTAATPAFAAPGTLPGSPLFLSNFVEPNIMLVVDDSYSMHWDTMYEDNVAGVPAKAGDPVISGQRKKYLHPDWTHTAGKFVIPPPPTDTPAFVPTGKDGSVNITNILPGAWAIRNHLANRIYYNPDIEYKPWPGTDASGNPLYKAVEPNFATDKVIVLQKPNVPLGNKADLRQVIKYTDPAVCEGCEFEVYLPTYFVWTDSNSNGVIDATDTHEKVEIKPSRTTYPSGRSYQDEMRNFANWFQYHRSRYAAAKAALGGVITNQSRSRMGLDLFLKGTKKYLTSMTSQANKAALLTTLYDAPYDWGTPTPKALDRVGKYYQSPPTGVDSILPIADGGECQQNFSVVVTDGFWTSTISTIGNADGDNNTKFDGSAYAHERTNTLADVAMLYYETDLRNGMKDLVPTTAGVDEASHQHMVTFAVGFGVKGTLDITKDPATTPDFAWPNPKPSTNKLEKIDDLWHAAYNGRGEYLSAQNPVELEKSLNEAIRSIAERTASASAVAVNSAKLTEKSVVYLAQFNSNGWQGSLYAFPVIDLTQGTLSATPKWEAGDKLDKRNLTTNPRQIITYDGANGVPFKWDTAKLSTAMLSDLRTNKSGGTDPDTTAEARLNYLRGDRSQEGSGLNFRPRQSLLGDIVNSGPVFVGDATLNWPDHSPFPTTAGSRYSDFRENTAKNRTKMVYVGANDGMLHAFSDTSGEEIFAFVPSFLSSSAPGKGLHYLTEPNYVHNWYVDLTPTLSDVYMTTNAGAGWHTILVGGVRGGGRGLYALEVTNPATFSEANAAKMVMWEFSDQDDPDLGYTYSRPVVAKANDGKWYAIFGNGYNDSGSGEAQLFMVDIESGISNAWKANTNYIKITTQSGNSANRNGLASPALADLDGNGTVDRVYAGDLTGNMWAFDLSSATRAKWDVAYKQGATPKPLFTTANNRPITAKPVLAKHPTIPFQSSPSNSPNLMVFFGTGQYLVDADKTSSDSQYFYGVWDKGDNSLDETKLVEQTHLLGYTNRVLSRNFVDYSTVYGWKISLPDSGERSVTSPIARADEVFFNTFIPNVDPCAVGGHGYRYAVDMESGGAPKEAVVDYNKDGVIDSLDNENGTGVITAVRQEGYLPEPVFIEDLVFTGEIAKKVKALADIPAGRFSWQELIKQ